MDQPIPPSPPRKSPLATVILVSMIFGLISGGLGAGTVVWTAMRNPQVMEQFRPLHNLLNRISTPAADKDIVQITLQEESAIIDAVEHASPAVVSIIGTVQVRSWFFNQIIENDFAGTGFIIDKSQGLILTNRHVVSE